jgi:enoyl-CoA hydratase
VSEEQQEHRDEVLLRERHGSVLVALINRPRKGNSLSHELIAALDALATDLGRGASDPDGARALVLAGAGGKAFSAGADVHDLDGVSASRAREQMRRGQQVFDRIEQLPLLVVAAVSGYAVGGGLELAMAADLRVAGPDARFGQPEITLDNLPGWGGTQRLPRLVGLGRATELILTGELIDAGRAYDIGLVNRVEADPLPAAITLAASIAQRSAVAVAGAKRALHAGFDGGFRTGLAVEADAVAACCETPMQRAAVQAFLNRRRGDS